MFLGSRLGVSYHRILRESVSLQFNDDISEFNSDTVPKT
jgi:hypothetical protein